MNIFQRNKVVIWVLAGLLVIVMSALGTMVYHRWVRPVPPKSMQECGVRCNLLVDELGLSETQAKSIDSIRAGYRRAGMATADSLRARRSQLVTELSNEPCDTFRLRQLAVEIGMLQTDLINQTIDQYLRIRKECTPEQREKLSSLYYELMGCCPQGEGKGMRERCRRK
jgi:Spy/CpxP family protein refolding chaperone